MKKLFRCLLMILAISFFFGSAQAEWMKNENGELRWVENQEVLKRLTTEEEDARKNPGTEVPFGSVVYENQRCPLKSFQDFFHYRLVQKRQNVVVFNSEKDKSGGFSYPSKETVLKGELKFAWYVVFLLVGLGAMVCSNYRAGRYGIDDGAIFAFAAAAIFAAVAAAFAAFAAAAAAFAAAFAAFAAAAAAVAEGIASYMIFSVIYYILIFLAMFV